MHAWELKLDTMLTERGGGGGVEIGPQVKNPGRDIPIGMCSALVIVTTLYFLCAITLNLMLPFDLISPDAAFSQVCVLQEQTGLLDCFVTLKLTAQGWEPPHTAGRPFRLRPSHSLEGTGSTGRHISPEAVSQVTQGVRPACRCASTKPSAVLRCSTLCRLWGCVRAGGGGGGSERGLRYGTCTHAGPPDGLVQLLLLSFAGGPWPKLG